MSQYYSYLKNMPYVVLIIAISYTQFLYFASLYSKFIGTEATDYRERKSHNCGLS